MQFDRLRLNGFKSFVDPVELVISGGLTGVVGPNGCGKSNLLEALRWVMGETRPTAMRGAGMEDVIFAGAAGRAARPFAEVALSIDNAERLAPPAFNDDDVLEVSRRITRDAGSLWRANGREVRARDVAMLFADASTGSQSPALVRQGQIATLIAAKPAQRRRVLEEAAGIAGLHHRRHEAELRLRAAEANLARVADVVAALDARLAALSRQARTAARYREIAEGLRRSEERLALARWSVAEADRTAADAACRDARRRAAETGRIAAAAGEARAAVETRLPPARDEVAIATALVARTGAASDTLRDRAERARRAIDALRTRLADMTRDAGREAALSEDAARAVAALEDEAAALSADGDGAPARLDAARAAAGDAAARSAQAQDAAVAAAGDVARQAAAHDAARRELAQARRSRSDAAAARDRAGTDAGVAQATVTTSLAQHAKASEAARICAAAATGAEAALELADATRAGAQTEEGDARAAASETAGQRAALQSEVAALDRLIARDTAEDGQLIDAITVAPGFEAAVGAALSEDLRAPPVGDNGATGWVGLPAYGSVAPLPREAAPLGDRLTGPAVLVRRIAAVGIVPRHRGAALQAVLSPGQRLVSVEGDLWRWDGFRSAAEDTPTAAALRLAQVNRREALKRDLSAADAVAVGTARAHDRLAARLLAASEAAAAARTARRRADDAAAEAGRQAGRADAARIAAETRAEASAQVLERAIRSDSTAEERLEAATAALAAAPAPDQKTVMDARLEARRALAEASGASRHADTVAAAEAARATRLSRIGDEIAGWQERAGAAAARVGELASRRDATQADLTRAEAAPDEIAARAARTARDLEAARIRSGAAVAAADAATRQAADAAEAERAAERAAAAAREALASAEARADAAASRAADAVAGIAEAFEMTPGALREKMCADPAAQPPDDAPIPAIEADIARLRSQRDGLGAVNLRAEADSDEARAEMDTLTAERDDLTGAIAALRAGIAGLNREGRERLLTAFDEVNGHFSQLFVHLFGGGTARLEMVDSDDPLEAGLDILCQPPGKTLSHLGLLSGGEQTLCAMALIFAVFLANPAPICVLDEVDAPLDDANVTRFCDMLDEMARRTDTRFLIITHHAVTMARMDRLYGVTMGEPGVSQLVSVDLAAAERLVA